MLKVGTTDAQGNKNTYGYAWLNAEGKVDTNLLPALAITETHVISQSTILTYEGGAGDAEGKTIFGRLNAYIKDQIKTNPEKAFQVGDIIIVTPVENADNNPNYIEQEYNFGDTKPYYCGSYIITAAAEKQSDGTETAWEFAKLAYTDSNIVKINGLAPANSAGELTIYLKNVLEQLYINNIPADKAGKTADEVATDLSDTVYRLRSIEGEGEDEFRFGFLTKEEGSFKVVPYAKLSELNTLENTVSSNYDSLSAALSNAVASLESSLTTAFNGLEEEIVTKANDLNDKILTVEHYISGEVSSLIDVVGTPSSAISFDTTGTLFGQTKGLRSSIADVDTKLNDTIAETNVYLSGIQENINSLYTNLSGKAIELEEVEFVLSQDNTNAVEINDGTQTFGDATGIIKWTLTYVPATNAAERIISVYDELGNEIIVDITRKVQDGKTISMLTLETENYGDDANTSLIGTTLTLLVARTITNINKNSASILDKLS
jgi:hypothetical protein